MKFPIQISSPDGKGGTFIEDSDSLLEFARIVLNLSHDFLANSSLDDILVAFKSKGYLVSDLK